MVSFKYEYFISFHKPSKDAAVLIDRVAREIGAKDTWCQPYDSRHNAALTANIRREISRSRHFVAVVCRDYDRSHWTMQEKEWFTDHCQINDPENRRLIVIKCEDVPTAECDKRFYGQLFNHPDEESKRAEIRRALRGESAETRPSLRHVHLGRMPMPLLCVGRERELATLRRHFFPDGDSYEQAWSAPPPPTCRRAVIHAGPGFGKSTLARQFVSETAQVEAALFKEVYWINAEKDVERQLAREFESSGGGPKITRASVLKSVEDHFKRQDFAPCLIVLDNVIGATWPWLKEELLPVLPSNVRVLSTSWPTFSAHWSADPATLPLQLEPLSLQDGALYLRTRAKREDDVKGSEDVAAKLGRHPLALSQAGAYCESEALSFSEYLRKYRAALSEHAGTEDYDHKHTVAATVALAMRGAKKREKKPSSSPTFSLTAPRTGFRGLCTPALLLTRAGGRLRRRPSIKLWRRSAA